MRYRVGVAAAVVVVVSVSAVVAQSGRFADVPPDHSAFEAVEWAAGVGLTHGKADGTFGVDDPLSKRHTVIFMERFYDTVLKADQSGDFTRGDMMMLLKEISDGTAEPVSVSVSPGAGSSETDRAALVALFNATDGPNWSKNKNWLTDEPLSAWEGVSTDHRGRVDGLYVGGYGLSGSIPSELGNLTNLDTLRLSWNSLGGSIPPELGQLANLRTLRLQGNPAMTGTIPDEVIGLVSFSLYDFQVGRGICIPEKQKQGAIELRIPAYECESDSRLLQSALIREDSNGVSIALPHDLRKPAGMSVSRPSVVAASVADGWLELAPRGIGTAQVELVPSGGGDPAMVEVVVRPAVGTFGIDIVMERPAPLTYAETLMTSADWWSAVLDGTDWPDRRDDCSHFDGKVKAIADELLIYAGTDLGGPSGAAYALPCFRSPGTQVALDPGGGEVRLTIHSAANSYYIVTHEIGHILGLVKWGPTTGLVSDDGAYFIGPQAVEAFREYGGDPGLPGVPIHDDRVHWDWSVSIPNTLYGIDRDDLFGPVSVAALADAGYTVAIRKPEPPWW